MHYHQHRTRQRYKIRAYALTSIDDKINQNQAQINVLKQ
jgi:hypothetical protein